MIYFILLTALKFLLFVVSIGLTLSWVQTLALLLVEISKDKAPYFTQLRGEKLNAILKMAAIFWGLFYFVSQFNIQIP